MGMPTTPSMPMTPTSTVSPSARVRTTEASPSSRKYACSLRRRAVGFGLSGRRVRDGARGGRFQLWGVLPVRDSYTVAGGGFIMLLCRRTASGRAYEPPTLAREMRIKMWNYYTLRQPFCYVRYRTKLRNNFVQRIRWVVYIETPRRSAVAHRGEQARSFPCP